MITRPFIFRKGFSKPILGIYSDKAIFSDFASSETSPRTWKWVTEGSCEIACIKAQNI